jgi:hypothetical protein
VKIKASGFDIAKKCFNEKPLAIGITGIRRVIKVGQEIERVFVACAMPDQCINAIDKALVCNGDRLQPKRGFALSGCERVKAKGLAVVFNGQIDRTA